MGKSIAIAALAFCCAAIPCVSRETGEYPARYRVAVETLDNGTTIESFRWGSLKVAFETFVDERYASTARVLDASGTALLELRCARFITPSLTEGGDDFTREFFLEPFADGGKALKITAWSGGAYGSYTDMLYVYDKEGGLRNVLAYDGGEGRIGKGSDDLADDDELNKIARGVLYRQDGVSVPHVVIADYGLHSLGGETHGSVLFALLRWEGDHFTVSNGDCPAISELAIERYRRRIDDAIGDSRREGVDEDAVSLGLASDVIGLLSNAAMIDRYDDALEWLRERLDGSAYVGANGENNHDGGAFRSLDERYSITAREAPSLVRKSVGVKDGAFLYLK